MSNQRKSILILGSTGSIGVNTLDVIRRHPDRFEVRGLVAGKNIDLLKVQCEQFKPRYVVICDEMALNQWNNQGYSEQLSTESGCRPEVYSQASLPDLTSEPGLDCVMAAIVGSAGLAPSLSALKAGKTVYLANKESLVLGGRFMLDACKQARAQLLPVDSEHNAIYQCLPHSFTAGDHENHGIHRLVLTASGGPFRSKPIEEMEHITPEQAVAHPNWDMGKKISVDSATMANKGLELIEAFWLFGLPAEQLSVVIHPQSIVHSMVEYTDSSVIAQMGCPDMRTPIAHVLGFPDRIESGSPRLDLAHLSQLTFENPDYRRFPMLKLAFEVLTNVAVAAPIYNAANEVAVDAFLGNKLGFLDIYRTVMECLDTFSSEYINHLDDAFDLDARVRHHAQQLISRAYAR
ncbi:MAG: 1-deoxy-D-xylulose-5-phosphate reductoisomerase [Limnobacter sp.]|nr:1-deoxy-D-xylulose-5-phosphate reductoisomerase [Limnobacter sp.]